MYLLKGTGGCYLELIVDGGDQGGREQFPAVIQRHHKISFEVQPVILLRIELVKHRVIDTVTALPSRPRTGFHFQDTLSLDLEDTGDAIARGMGDQPTLSDFRIIFGFGENGERVMGGTDNGLNWWC